MKVQEGSSIILAGVIALGSGLLAERVGRRGSPAIRVNLEAVLDRATRIDAADRLTRAQQELPRAKQV